MVVKGKNVKNVQTFCYLGHPLSNVTKDAFMGRRIGMALDKFNAMNMLEDKKVYMSTRVKIAESCVRSRLTYAIQGIEDVTAIQLKKLSSTWMSCLRKMVYGGFKKKYTEEELDENENLSEYSLKFTNQHIYNITKSPALDDYCSALYAQYIGHICRRNNTNWTKIMLFMTNTRKYYRNPWKKLSRMLKVDENQVKRMTQKRGDFTTLISTQFPHYRRDFEV